MQAVVQILSFLPNLNTLILRETEINGSAMTNLINAFQQIDGFDGLPNLLNVDLSGNNLGAFGSGGVHSLSTLLLFTPNLEALNLAGNNLSGNLESIAPALARMTNLQTLNLSWNSLDGNSMIDFMILFQSEGSEEISNLQALDLHGNNLNAISPKGEDALQEILSSLTNLLKLDLRCNDLGEH